MRSELSITNYFECFEHSAWLSCTMMEGTRSQSRLDWAWQVAKSYITSSLQELKAMDKPRFGLQAVNLGEGDRGPLALLCGRCRLEIDVEGTLPPAGTLITTGLMIWKFLVLLTGSDSPV